VTTIIDEKASDLLYISPQAKGNFLCFLEHCKPGFLSSCEILRIVANCKHRKDNSSLFTEILFSLSKPFHCLRLMSYTERDKTRFELVLPKVSSLHWWGICALVQFSVTLLSWQWVSKNQWGYSALTDCKTPDLQWLSEYWNEVTLGIF
jgi:hypothetical protein